MKPRAKSVGRILKESLGRFNNLPPEEMESARVQALKYLESHFDDAARGEMLDAGPIPPVRRFQWLAAGIVAAVILLAVLIPAVVPLGPILAVLQTVDASRNLAYGEVARVDDATSGTLLLKDGSRVEVRAKSEFTLERALDGVRIRLNEGGLIVNAAKQVAGRHLYVRTTDVTVSVVGTVFFVSAEVEGSRIAVIEGEVRVQQGATEKRLRPGEQVTTVSTMAPQSVAEEISWSRNVEEHMALLARLQNVTTAPPFPGASRPPEFEVAAIHPGPPGDTSSRADSGNERVTLQNVTLKSIICYAFGMKDHQIEGPERLMSARYTIAAKAPSGTPNSRLLPMLQPLLADRFKMVARRVTRETPAYALVVQHNDRIKTRELAPGELSSGVGGGMHSPTDLSSWRFIGTLSSLADSLSRRMPDRPVLDLTGLTGRYSFSLSYASESAIRQGVSGPSLAVALEDEVGLKLEPRRLPVEFLIIEHIEEPSDN